MRAEGAGSRVTCGPSRRRPRAHGHCVPTRPRLPGGEWSPQQGLPQRTGYRGQQEQTASREDGRRRGQQQAPPYPAGGDVGAPVLPPERRPRPPAPLLGGAPSSREAWCREASWAGDPRAAPALHEERPGSTSLASERAGASPASRAEALGPGEAAHLAVAGARLVHEGAVLTGPHGGRGGM